jgi:spoIIIJ-associated protein
MSYSDVESPSQSTDPSEFHQRLLEFVDHLFRSMEFNLNSDISVSDGMLFLNMAGRDAEDLLAGHMELLNAVEYLLNKIFQAEVHQHGMINCDVMGKKQTRMTELKLIAEAAADKVRETKMPFRLSPMDSRERRIVHLAVADDQTIRTESEGEGEFRKVVIYPAE